MNDSDREGIDTIQGIKNGILASVLWWVPVISAGICIWRWS